MPPPSSPSPPSAKRPGPLQARASVDIFASTAAAFRALKPLVEELGIPAQMPSALADELRPSRLGRRCSPPVRFMPCALVASPEDLELAGALGWPEVAYLAPKGAEVAAEGPWDAVRFIAAADKLPAYRKAAPNAQVLEPGKLAAALLARFPAKPLAQPDELGDWGGAPLPA